MTRPQLAFLSHAHRKSTVPANLSEGISNFYPTEKVRSPEKPPYRHETCNDGKMRSEG